MSDYKLAPCPFCGERERIELAGSRYVCCVCGAIGPNVDPDGFRWNASATSPESGMTREEIATRLYAAGKLPPEVACNYAESLIEEFVRRGWRKEGETC